MKVWSIVATVAISCVLSTGIGFVLGTAAQPATAGASDTSAIVSQLKQLNKNADLGEIYKDTTALGALWEIEHDTTDIAKIADELHQITLNTYETCKDASQTVLCDF